MYSLYPVKPRKQDNQICSGLLWNTRGSCSQRKKEERVKRDTTHRSTYESLCRDLIGQPEWRLEILIGWNHMVTRTRAQIAFPERSIMTSLTHVHLNQWRALVYQKVPLPMAHGCSMVPHIYDWDNYQYFMILVCYILIIPKRLIRSQ